MATGYPTIQTDPWGSHGYPGYRQGKRTFVKKLSIGNADYEAQYNALFPKKTLFKRLKQNTSEASQESKPSKADESEDNLLVGISEEEEGEQGEKR